MTSARDRQRHREQRELKRREAARGITAAETQKRQAEAAARREFQDRRKRHAVAHSLFVVAGVMAISHFFEHAGMIQPLPQKTSDLLIGWPMAALLAMIGGIVYGV